MKTNELIKKAETMGFTVGNKDNNFDWLEILQDNLIVAQIDKDKSFLLSTDYESFHQLNDKFKKQLFGLLTEYASTPIEEREEKKEYMYRLKQIDGVNYFSGQYLNWDNSEKIFLLNNKWENCNYKTKFTHSWLKEHEVNIRQLQEVYDEIEATK